MQKRDLIHKLTEAMVSVGGEVLRDKTFVLVKEVKTGDWGIGGQAITTEMVKAMQAGAVSSPTR